MYFPRNWEFGSALSKLRNSFGGGAGGVWTPQTHPLGTPVHYTVTAVQHSSVHYTVTAVQHSSVHYTVTAVQHSSVHSTVTAVQHSSTHQTGCVCYRILCVMHLLYNIHNTRRISTLCCVFTSATVTGCTGHWHMKSTFKHFQTLF
jgi:hypothetical protein